MREANDGAAESITFVKRPHENINDLGCHILSHMCQDCKILEEFVRTSKIVKKSLVL